MLEIGTHRCDGCKKTFGPKGTQAFMGLWEFCPPCFREFRRLNPRPFAFTTPDVPASEPDGENHE